MLHTVCSVVIFKGTRMYHRIDPPLDKVKSGIPREKESKVDCADGLFPKGNEKSGSTDFLNYLVIILSQF